jgi:hypothetical protein
VKLQYAYVKLQYAYVKVQYAYVKVQYACVKLQYACVKLQYAYEYFEFNVIFIFSSISPLSFSSARTLRFFQMIYYGIAMFCSLVTRRECALLSALVLRPM